MNGGGNAPTVKHLIPAYKLRGIDDQSALLLYPVKIFLSQKIPSRIIPILLSALRIAKYRTRLKFQCGIRLNDPNGQLQVGRKQKPEFVSFLRGIDLMGKFIRE